MSSGILVNTYMQIADSNLFFFSFKESHSLLLSQFAIGKPAKKNKKENTKQQQKKKKKRHN